MRLSSQCRRDPFWVLILAGGLLVLGGCALLSDKLPVPSEIKAILPPTYDELMGQADDARKKGGVVEAMGLYEKAAKADPSKKQPWARIAQAQFDARNYGSAINAAEEVLQRDTSDVSAKSILAVSGLRVFADGLDQLRQASALGVLGGSARDEAQSLARVMRDALGEAILPPAAVASEPARAGVTRPALRRALPALPAAPAPTVAPPAELPKRNPFDALKG